MGALIGVGGGGRPSFPYNEWYGIEGDTTSSSASFKRIAGEGMMSLHTTLPIQSRIRRFVENLDGSVKYYLHQNDSRFKADGTPADLTGADGNVMLEIPAYYFKLEWHGTKWRRMWSEHPLPGFILKPRRTISPWYGTVYTGETGAEGSAFVNNGIVSNCLLSWETMVLGDMSPILRDENGFVDFTPHLAIAQACRGGSGSGDAAKDGTENSQLGMARTSVSKANVRTYQGNVNTANGITDADKKLHHGAFRAYNELAWLMRCEYANYNGQLAITEDSETDTVTRTTVDNTTTPPTTRTETVGVKRGGIGSGPTFSGDPWNAWGGYKPFIPCGTTATLGNHSGEVLFVLKDHNATNGERTFHVNSYRGFELPFNFLWMLAEDILVWNTEDGRRAFYLCRDTDKFTNAADGATAPPDGYEHIGDGPTSDGWLLRENHTEDGYSCPKDRGGDSTTGVTDYYYQSTSGQGWFGVLLSAAALNGTVAGFGCVSAVDRSSYASAHFGFRLCRN